MSSSLRTDRRASCNVGEHRGHLALAPKKVLTKKARQDPTSAVPKASRGAVGAAPGATRKEQMMVVPTGSRDENGTKIFRTDRFRFLYYDIISEFYQT